MIEKNWSKMTGGKFPSVLEEEANEMDKLSERKLWGS